MQQRKRILIIDDEEVILFGFSMVLREPDVEVDCAQTLMAAKNFLTSRQYDAAIVDLRLSDSTDLEGFDCIRLIHAHQNSCRSIVLTAYGDIKVREQTTLLGVDRFFEKPIGPDVIREILVTFGIYGNRKC